MNQASLRRRAAELEVLLQQYAPQVPDASKLQRALQGLLQKSLEGQLENPVEWKAIPGDLLFSEGTLSAFLDLSSAYSKFEVEATGGPSPVLQQFRSEHGFHPHTWDPVLYIAVIKTWAPGRVKTNLPNDGSTTSRRANS